MAVSHPVGWTQEGVWGVGGDLSLWPSQRAGSGYVQRTVEHEKHEDDLCRNRKQATQSMGVSPSPTLSASAEGATKKSTR